MNLYGSTSKTLWWGAIIGITIIALGLIVESLGFGDLVLWLGLLILIISPMLGVVVSMTCLIKDKNYRWAAVALLLIVMTIVSIAITAFF
ncbi:MAG TPA: hypothetical protein VJY42_01190 [Candidatus Methanomethylophilaceae archaeon]|nr:hypothetical protein [Candidatus Methanomethylophilaceae archaeon]